MLPRFASRNQVDVLSTDGKRPADGQRRFSGLLSSSYLANVFGCDFRVVCLNATMGQFWMKAKGMACAHRGSSLADPVFSVFLGSCCEQMRRIYASRCIAGVANLLTARYFSECHFVGDAVRSALFTVQSKAAVALVRCGRPNPAALSFIDLVPEAVQRLWLHVLLISAVFESAIVRTLKTVLVHRDLRELQVRRIAWNKFDTDRAFIVPSQHLNHVQWDVELPRLVPTVPRTQRSELHGVIEKFRSHAFHYTPQGYAKASTVTP